MADLLILHGPPASGKLTTAKQVSALTGSAVFHNHLTLDVAKALLEFGAEGFWNLVDDIRIRAFETHFEHGTSTVLFTWCYEDPNDEELLNRIQAIATKHGGRILPVYLKCSTPSLEDRVANQERQAMNKLSSVDRLKSILSSKNYGAIPYENCLEIDSDSSSAESNARKIVEYFEL